MSNLIPSSIEEMAGIYTGNESNLEDEIQLEDFFRKEPGYDPSRPFVTTKTGGLMAFYVMDGVDPEPLSNEQIDQACAAIKRASDNFGVSQIDHRWKGGQWEILNIYRRRRGVTPKIKPPTVKNAATEFLSEVYNEFWSQRNTLVDELVWVIGFNPKLSGSLDQWKATLPDYYNELYDSKQVALAGMLRRKLKAWEEDILSFSILRPPTQFGLRPLGEAEVYQLLFGLVNRTEEEPPRYKPGRPLHRQVAYSRRDNTGNYYKVEGQYCNVLTFKDAPDETMGYGMRILQDRCDFPFTLVHCWNSVDPAEMQKFINFQMMFATSLAKTNKTVAAWKEEADEYQHSITVDSSAPFTWKTSIIVLGQSLSEMRDRSSRLSSYLKQLSGAQPMEESPKTRKLAEVGSLPGNQFMNLRPNHCTSVNIGDMSFAFRFGLGAKDPHLLFGDRRGGCWGYNLYSPALPSWNKVILGLPGCGKSVLMNHDLMALAMHDSQIYVCDEGNSYGPIFEYFAEENPGDVAVMRFAGGDFQFNPFPLVWAIEEKERQIADGTYKMPIGDGEILPCPVEMAQEIFGNWLEVLLGDGKPFTAEQRNKLDIALKGKKAGSGFFNSYEVFCRSYLESCKVEDGYKLEPPQPLSQLLQYVRTEAAEFEHALEYWTRQPQKKYFDSGYDSVSSAQKIYFELSGLEQSKHVAKPFVAALMMTVWRRFTNPRFIHQPKAFKIDEAWAYVCDPTFAGPIDRMQRTARKFGGEITLASQKPQDLDNPQLRGIIETCTQAFLYPGFASDVFLREQLGFNDHQVDLYQSLQSDDRTRETLYWNRLGMTKVGVFEVEPHWYWLVTTSADDKVLRGKFRKSFPDRRQQIEALCKACDGKTIVSKSYRVSKVREYAKKHGIALA